MDTIVGPVHQAAVLRLVSSLWTRDVTVACGQVRLNCVRWWFEKSLVRDVSHLCDVSIIDLSKMTRASFQAFYDHFSHETYKHHGSTVTCSERKWKNPPGQNDHSRQKQTTRWKYFFVSIIILGHEYTGSASLVGLKLLDRALKPLTAGITLSPFTPKSDQCQNSTAASQEI